MVIKFAAIIYEIIKKHVNIFFITTVIFGFIIVFSNFIISNDGRHYLSAAESLKTSGFYSCLGYSTSWENLNFLVDWPPIYSTFIGLIAFFFRISVYLSAKILHIIIFLITALLIEKVFKNQNLLKLTTLIIVFNSSNYNYSNAEVLFLPFLFIIYLNLNFLQSRYFVFGLIIGLSYLIKYSFIYLLPVSVFFIIVSRINNESKNLFNANQISNIIKAILKFSLGYFLIFLTWHFFVFKFTGHFFPSFIGSKIEVDFFQFFNDLVVSWNFCPERFEDMALFPGIILFLGIVIFLFIRIFRAYKASVIFTNIFIFNLILFIGWLSFLILECYLHGISTKRYIEGSELILLYILISNEISFGEKSNKLVISVILFFQLFFLSNFIRLRIQSGYNLSEAFENVKIINEINKELSATKQYIIGFDKSLMGGLVEKEHWNRIIELDTNVGSFNLPRNEEQSIYLIQHRDTQYRDYRLLKIDDRIKYIINR